ncbi:MAG: ATP-dependent DNA ligase [Propionibacteriales bacterium]|nr:ATP-dependent DNA ligase [Propionibacteriales bacterium]
MPSRGSSSSQTVTIDGRRLRLTNPDKVLYPASGTTKAEVISYYVAVADRLLPHASGRPVTRKRWPDGVGQGTGGGSGPRADGGTGGGSGPRAEKESEVFFEKNLPDSAPDWVRRVVVRHKSHVNVYPLVDGPAALAWLGQVAALELHVPQWRVEADGTPRHPDRLVLDLDPGPGTGLAECVEVAHAARELLADVGLEAFPVTSGSKGLHLYAHLGGEHDADYVNAFARQVAAALQDELPDLVVSSMKKSLREGRVLVDWSQNNQAKTTIAPYSLRGRAAAEGEGPFVAAPRSWDELGPDLRHLTMEEVLERDDDPLEGLDPQSTSGDEAPAAAPDRLTVYRSMRDASRTPEPVPAEAPTERGDDPVFVVQEHHATRLHYDVRLEREGVLVSWAVPKGPPTDPGRNHLAVPTEDHPMEYAAFEGTIPKGEYGAGQVSIWDHGTYTLEKWKEGEVIAVLHGSEGGGLGGSVRFALIRTGENWLMHRMDPAAVPDPPAEDAPATDAEADEPEGTAVDLLPTVAPMLASRPDGLDPHRDADAWAFEMKWDGVRVVATCDGASVRLVGRSGKDVTATYPEVAESLAGLHLDDAVVDGEVVALDDDGAPSFGRIQQRIGLVRPRDVASARKAVPVRYVAFDLLRLGGSDVTGLPYVQRRELLEGLDLDDADMVDVPAAFEGDLDAALASSRQLGLEGVVAKRRSSRYRPGSRSAHWVKLKLEDHVEVVVVGWRPGRGGRTGGIGSLLVAVPDETGALRYAGRVGTGFDARTLGDLARRLEPLRREQPTVETPRDVAREAVWTEPDLVGEVTAAGWTDSGHLRHPVWRGLRTDKTADDVEPVATHRPAPS